MMQFHPIAWRRILFWLRGVARLAWFRLGNVLTLLSLSLCSGLAQSASSIEWSTPSSLPDELGVAGPFVGLHHDALLVAGGANFTPPVWESEKIWHTRIHVLTRNQTGYQWHDGGQLDRPIAYGANVSLADGVVCMGGSDGHEVFDTVFMLRWDPKTRSVQTQPLPSLPQPSVHGQAALINQTIYLAGGQQDLALETATDQLWALDMSQEGDDQAFAWRVLQPIPGGARAFNLTLTQHNGYEESLYVLSGRREDQQGIHFLTDMWEYQPSKASWRYRQGPPRCVMAGSGVAWGQSHLLILGGADGSLFDQGDQLKEDHPGFPRQALAYHTITDTWTSAGPLPETQVTTTAVVWGEDIILPSGEIRPRVRTAAIRQGRITNQAASFGWLHYLILSGYLAAMVGIGIGFHRRHRRSEDFFQAGRRIPWWAAGCSIFATMLSSLTFTGVPAKAYAQDWVYAVGNLMIPVVAILAVWLALPFFRRLDAISAYAYLEHRFHRGLRLFGSASFTLFHLFRMAIVMSLTGLALAAATPLGPVTSVLLMGLLSILYCSLGGIEAVIWTDTLQTIVLLGGAIFALGWLIQGSEAGWIGFVETARQSDKFRLANWHGDPSSMQIAFWVIVVGGIGQNIASYTADQAVVQRYMTTATQQQAARSIWTNGLMCIFSTLLFFGIGTALFTFYQHHPDRLDWSIHTDQIFPLFIARELPAWLAGLMIAAIFAAAQSTVSTSMNSMATTLVSDFLRPGGRITSDGQALNAARILTALSGLAGTALALLFIKPDMRSLFDAFIKVIGLFMGVLGGLFMLGMLTRRANTQGATAGIVAGSGTMLYLWLFTSINGYLYTAIGITTCMVIGYLVSRCTGGNHRPLDDLTLFTQSGRKPDSQS